MSNNPKGHNQYKRGSAKIKIVIVLILLAIATYYGYKPVKNYIVSKQTPTVYKVEVAEPVKTPEEIKASDIEKRTEQVRARAEHQEKVKAYDLNEAKKVATKEYEADKKAEYEKKKAEMDAEYSKVKSEIEKSKEDVRKNEVNFQ